MIMTSLYLASAGLVSLVLVAGCSSPASDAEGGDSTAEAVYSTGSWQRLLTCNGGAAVLDVDTGERRHLQLVIHDANAINYVTGAVHQQMLLDRGNGRELIAAGWSTAGVFQPSELGSFTEDASDYSSRVRVFREGKGVKVVFELHRREGGFCTDWCSDFCCGGYAGASDVYPELANWYFDDCR